MGGNQRRQARIRLGLLTLAAGVLLLIAAGGHAQASFGDFLQPRPLVVSGIKASSGFQANSSCGVLASGASCTISVTFTRGATPVKA